MDRLRRRWAAGTLLCVGLDPEPERLPAPLAHRPSAEALLAFNTALVDATADLVCAYKPNSAFYEAHGPDGLQALQRTITYIHERAPDVPVLLDAKRGDMANTSHAYARAIFDIYGADAVTVQPYQGQEALAPFLERADRGVFILCRTSNPGAGELQDLPVGRDPLYLHLAGRVADAWNTHGNCGLVVGATWPDELRAVRSRAAALPILLPGIGAQGGDLAASVRAGLDADGMGLLVSVSRGVIYASSDDDFAAAARRAATRLRDEINHHRPATTATPTTATPTTATPTTATPTT
jgi:orotidine-5'-phosphate decarboxylase